MKKQLERRLKALRTELETGQKMLAELETRQVNLKSTVLRISGAIQVLEEELARDPNNRSQAENTEYAAVNE